MSAKTLSATAPVVVKRKGSASVLPSETTHAWMTSSPLYSAYPYRQESDMQRPLKWQLELFEGVARVF